MFAPALQALSESRRHARRRAPTLTAGDLEPEDVVELFETIRTPSRPAPAVGPFRRFITQLSLAVCGR